jgi:hypothetical protein
MEGICMGLKLSLWPIFQKDMDAQIESVKKLADTAVGGGFGSLLSKPVKDATVRQVSERYAEFFSFIVALSEDEEEGMIFTRYAGFISQRTEDKQLNYISIKYNPTARRAQPTDLSPERKNKRNGTASLLPFGCVYRHHSRIGHWAWSHKSSEIAIRALFLPNKRRGNKTTHLNH